MLFRGRTLTDLYSQIQALAGSEVVGEPITVTINVLDINNHAPIFEQNVYIATIREHSRPGVWDERMNTRTF